MRADKAPLGSRAIKPREVVALGRRGRITRVLALARRPVSEPEIIPVGEQLRLLA